MKKRKQPIKGVEAESEKVEYCLFWLYQYLRRSKEYQEAWTVFADCVENGVPCQDCRYRLECEHQNYYGRKASLVARYGHTPPNLDYYSIIDTPWLRDDKGVVYNSEKKGVTSARILETLLDIKEKQGCRDMQNIKCSYIVPEFIWENHAFADFEITERLNKMQRKAAGPIKTDYLKSDIGDIVRNFIDQLALRTEFQKLKSKESLWVLPMMKAKAMWHLPRAVGLVLYDYYIENGESLTDAVNKFLGHYGEEQRGDDGNLTGGDLRLPPIYRIIGHGGLYRPLQRTIECIETLEVLPMK